MFAATSFVEADEDSVNEAVLADDLYAGVYPLFICARSRRRAPVSWFDDFTL